MREKMWLSFWLLLGGLVSPARTAEPDHRPPGAWEHTLGFQLASGLRLEIWATEPQVQNGVALSFDERGRCYVAETHRYTDSIFDITQRTNWLLNDLAFRSPADRSEFLVAQFATVQPELLTRRSETVRVLEDRTGTGRADFSDLFATGFNSPIDGTAAGVLARENRVWFANMPSLWRMDAEPSEGPSRPRTAIARGFGVHIGVTGHDLHGLIKGPDGRIYMSFGDRGLDVSTLTNLAPVPPHVEWTLRDTGGVLRCEPDGTDLELFCLGLRNPQELAFDALGNLWTVDNDTAGADPCRVLHLVEGADYGWRCSYQHLAGFGPWVHEELWKGGQDGILPSAGTVSQGPSGLAFYPGTGFGDRFTGRFLHCDFPGGIWSYSVRPAGATYLVDQKQKVLWNCWATDVDFAPDGAAYVLDWVNGWQRPDKGRIYRITDPARTNDPMVAEVRQVLAGGMKSRTLPQLLGWLGHVDRRVRLEAHWELASRGPSALPGLISVAQSRSNLAARLHALWATSIILRRAPMSVGAAELASLLKLLADPDPEIRGQTALTVLGDGRLVNAERAAAPLLEDVSPRVRLLALQAYHRRFRVPGYSRQVVRMFSEKVGSNGSVEGHLPTAELARVLESGATDPFLADAAAQFLTLIPAGEFSRRFVGGTSVEIRLAALLAWRRQARPGIISFLSDPSPRLVTEAGRAIHDVPVAASFPSLAQLLTRVDCPTNLYSRVIDACLRLGSARHAIMVANFAARADVPARARAEAIRALGEWAEPGPLDRVNGLWRPMVAQRNQETEDTDAPPESTANPALVAALDAASVPGPVSRFDRPNSLPADLGRSSTFAEGMAVRRRDASAKKAFLGKAGEYVASGDPEIQLAVIYAAVRLRAKEASSHLFELFQSSATTLIVRSAIVPALVALKAAQTGEAVRLALATRDPALQASAVTHLDHLDGEDALSLLTSFVSPDAMLRDPLATQAALGALAKMEAPEADNLLLAAMQSLREGSLPPGLRLDLVSAVERRASRVPALAEALHAYESSLKPGDPLARYRDTLQGGSAERGRTIFFDHPSAQCLRCHQVAAAAGTVGPKLDGIGKRRERQYILESVIQPNLHFAEGYVPAAGTQSAMPEGYGEMLTRLELRDLVEFLAGLK